ncbi:MAG: MFS transporter [Candidatus Zhuqueibacterota bacterium]
MNEEKSKPTKLWNRNYLLLWQGQAVSKIGSQLYLIAIVLWLKHATESGTLMGLMPALSGVILVLLGPIAGTFADRYSRRKIIILTDLLSGIAVIALAVLVFLHGGNTELVVLGIFIISIIMAILSSFFSPAIEASIPDIVPKAQLRGANTLSQLSNQIAMLIGQGLGGTFFIILGGPLIFLINGMSFLFSGVSTMFVSIPQSLPESTTGGWKKQFREFKANTMEGFHYIWQKSGLRELFSVSAVLNFFTMPVIILLPFLVEDHLKVNVAWYGTLMAVYAVGSLLGYTFGSIRKSNGRERRTFIITFLILEATAYAVMGVVSSLVMAMILATFAGFAGGFITLNITTLLQITTPGNIRGRVFGALGTLVASIAPLGMALGGFAFDLLDKNVTAIYVTCGSVMAALSIMISFNKKFREYISFELAEEKAV